ncbi:hypothetical protein EF096_10145 [Pseudomonas neustonica]|uniref:Uncharacterized protein n=1 Tax=Pseudomonas neustonica TaxID=2487346 RepID=A0ABX9XHY7_9PSED|nr:hypothetical protein EF099_11285 [Pseudomonas sp. SSM44]ROZ84747.1 hypothetical protein EF096_10145 [Pseudomonas neustonica]
MVAIGKPASLNKGERPENDSRTDNEFLHPASRSHWRPILTRDSPKTTSTSQPKHLLGWTQGIPGPKLGFSASC